MKFQERGKHLIVIDDNYDSFDSSDDTIGIKTWFNERYVKDTSKKIKESNWSQTKRRHSYDKTAFRILSGWKDKSIIKIVPKEAEFVEKWFMTFISPVPVIVK